MGPKRTKFWRPEQLDTKEFGKMVKKNPNSRGRKSPSKGGKELEHRRRKEKNYEKGI